MVQSTLVQVKVFVCLCLMESVPVNFSFKDADFTEQFPVLQAISYLCIVNFLFCFLGTIVNFCITRT